MAMARVRVHGLVQGVFFRDSCRREAIARGVTGWVRNTDDDCVEAVFSGDAEDVEALCRWCAEGPPGARVDRVERLDVRGDEPTATTFSVR